MFIQKLTEKSIAIQNMRVQGYDKAANGSKELVDLRNRKYIRKHFITVLINVLMPVWYFCKHKVEEECLFVLLYVTQPWDITSPIAMVRVPCVGCPWIGCPWIGDPWVRGWGNGGLGN